MKNFTIGEAWSQGMAFLSAHFRMILIYVAAGVLIPQILQLAILGGSMDQLFNPQAMMANGGDPMAMFAGLGAGFFLIAIVGNIIQSASYYAAWRHGMSNGTEEPAGAVLYGLGAGAMSLLAQIALVVLLVIVIALPIGLLVGFGAAGGGSPAAMGGLALVLVPLLLVFFLWIAARLSCLGPAMADARSINPLYGITTSWQLTRASQWSIVGYLVVLMVAALVLFMVVGLVAGIGMAGAMAAGGGEPGTGVMLTTLIVAFVIGIPIALAYVAIPAGIYRALVSNDASDVFA